MNSGRSEGPVKSSRLDVPRGLFVLRYVERETSNPPLITVRPVPSTEHLLTVIHHPDVSPISLENPGAVLVVASLGGAALEISVQARPFGSTEARVDLEPLGLVPSSNYANGSAGMGGQRGIPEPAQGLVRDATGQNKDVEVSILGHVARRGDVIAHGGEWIAGPEAPSPIEGIEIRTKPAEAFWFEGQVLVSGESNWSRWGAPGQFLGSRGRARPLVGIRLRTTPAAPAGLRIEAAALFLGSPTVKRSGQQIEFRSAAGNDPIVGFKFDAVREIEERVEVPLSSGRGRVRVFRASSNGLRPGV